MKENIIADRSFDFALDIINLCEELYGLHRFVLADQLLRSGTSIGANVEEASAAQSRKDFISKMAIASKEARESRYWLRLLQRSQTIKKDYSAYMQNISEIVSILTAIVKTASSSFEKYLR